MKMIWGLCLLCLAGSLKTLHAGPIRKPGNLEENAATEEEVNVLMFGVIQFSESLSYAFETTEAKIAKISQTLTSQEETLHMLQTQTEQSAEADKHIREAVQFLQAQMAEQQAQTEMSKDWLANVEQKEVELNTKVEKLEMYLNDSIPTSIKELQEKAEDHLDVLRGLQHLIQFQKEKINSQDDQLSKLQQMSEAMDQSFSAEVS